MTITPDVRLEYLEGVATLILKFKPDKWSKMVGAEENVALFTEFFEKPDVLVLVLTLSPAGVIIPCLGFPASLKSKGVYFIKKKPGNVKKDTYKDQLIYGDISPTPVEHLIAVVEEVGARAGQGPEEGSLVVGGLEPCHSWGGPRATGISLPGTPLEMQEP